MPDSQRRRALFAFGTVSCAYFAYAGLFGAYAPLWFQSLGYSTLTIGVLASMQSATRVIGPYAWGWLADHSGRRTKMLRIAVALSFACSIGFLVSPGFGWVATVMVALFMCTAGVIPIHEAALAHLVSTGGVFDVARYGRVRVWGSIGFVAAVTVGGYVLQALGTGIFPWLVVLLLGFLMIAALRLPVIMEPSHPTLELAGALRVLREPVVAWFFLGTFLTVMAHTALYVFLSLYLVSLGYGKDAVGLLWVVGVVVEVCWFWFQGHWLHRLSVHGWLVLAAVVSSLRFGVMAACGGRAWILVLAQCTHAFTFAAQHSACIAVINRHFPGKLRGRGQALYTVLGYGASGVVGGVAGGALSQRLGFGAVFWAASIVAMLAALCSWRALVLERGSRSIWGQGRH
jgi:PPP family 3-phenylpropionic acid transporter